MHDPEGLFGGVRPEPGTRIKEETDASANLTESVQEALETLGRGGGALEEGGDVPGMERIRNSKSGPAIRHVDAPGRPVMSWVDGDLVYINTAHPAYRKAVEKKVIEYHDLVAVAVAMLREVPTTQERIELLERFMSGWGRV
jgi:hypothetical protein